MATRQMNEKDNPDKSSCSRHICRLERQKYWKNKFQIESLFYKHAMLDDD